MSELADFQIGASIDEVSSSDLLAIGAALHTLSVLCKASACAKDFRLSGQIQSALTAEAQVEAQYKRLPPSWRW